MKKKAKIKKHPYLEVRDTFDDIDSQLNILSWAIFNTTFKDLIPIHLGRYSEQIQCMRDIIKVLSKEFNNLYYKDIEKPLSGEENKRVRELLR